MRQPSLRRVEQVAVGEALSAAERTSLDRGIRRAEQLTRFEFSVYVGSVEVADPRVFADQLHSQLVVPDRSVLILVDPRRRVCEVVTGGVVRRRLTDAEVDLALLAMQSEFAGGALVTGLLRGIAMMAEHARS